MTKFTASEIEYLRGQRLGRLATVNTKGDLHVVPVAFHYNAAEDTIDIGGHGMLTSRKYREAVRHGRVAFVVDDVLAPGRPRMVEVRGTIQPLPDGGKAINAGFPPDIIRLTPTYIVSMGVEDDSVHPREGNVHYHGRKV